MDGLSADQAADKYHFTKSQRVMLHELLEDYRDELVLSLIHILSVFAWKLLLLCWRVSCIPVSYTHLDVYKRQRHNLSHPL